MKKISISILVLGLLVAGCQTNKKSSNNKNVCDIDCETADMEGYEGFQDENHVFLNITFQQANEFIEDESFRGIIYFGFDTCPWCIEAVPIMNKVAKADGLSIYYVNKKSEENLANPEWLEETTALLDKAYGLDLDDDGTPVLYVPEVIVIKDGVIVDHHMGTLDDHDATKRKMTTAEQKELQSIYEDMFAKLK